jgi:hypothetical protein
MERRRILLGGLLTLVGAAFSRSESAAAADDSRVTGCWIPQRNVSGLFARSSGAMLFGEGAGSLQQHSDIPGLDYALAQSLGKIAKTFAVHPAFAFYPDGRGQENARATPERLLENADGTVLFGLDLLRELLARPEHGDASVVAVCAHEFGHIVSYKNGDIAQLAPNQDQPFRAEQYADFMSGYFAGRRKLERPDFPAVVFATTCRSFGGGNHGTGEQRGEAVQEGFLTAFRDRADTDAGVAAALRFAMSRSLTY